MIWSDFSPGVQPEDEKAQSAASETLCKIEIEIVVPGRHIRLHCKPLVMEQFEVF